jgi:hypothetical protein
MEERDEKDLQNPEIAVYNFRGYTAIRYYKNPENPRWKGELEFGDNAKMCSFIPEDYLMMARFLEECYKHRTGEVEDVKNVEVN